MELKELEKMLEERKDLLKRAEHTYMQVAGQVKLLEELIDKQSKNTVSESK